MYKLQKRTEIERHKILGVHPKMLESPRCIEEAYRIPPDAIHRLESAVQHDFRVYMYIDETSGVLNIEVLKETEVDDPEADMRVLNDEN